MGSHSLAIATARMKILIGIILLVSYLFSNGSAKISLTVVDGNVEEVACCKGDDILTCEQISVNATALGDDELEVTPLGETLHFKGMIDDSKDTYNYANNNTDAVLSYNATSGGISGVISDGNSRVFHVIEFCGNGITVLKTLDLQNIGVNQNMGVNVEEDDLKEEEATTMIPV